MTIFLISTVLVWLPRCCVKIVKTMYEGTQYKATGLYRDWKSTPKKRHRNKREQTEVE